MGKDSILASLPAGLQGLGFSFIKTGASTSLGKEELFRVSSLHHSFSPERPEAFVWNEASPYPAFAARKAGHGK
jgi:hypothetical protein